MPPAVVGDVFAFPLQSGRIAYAHYIALHPEFGSLVRIHRSEESTVCSVGEVGSLPMPFAPVFVGLYPAVRSGRWRKIGVLAPPSTRFPRFRWTLGTRPGRYMDWRIWDGETDVFVGELPV